MSENTPQQPAPEAVPNVGVEVAQKFLLEQYSERIYAFYPDILAIIDAEGHFARLNPAFETLTGHTADTALGREVDSLLHPDDRDTFRRCREAVRSAEDRFNVVARIGTADGRWCWIAWSCFAGLEAGSLFCVGRDVSAQKEAEISLVRREQQLEQVIELAGVPTWELDLGTLEFVFNDHMLTLLGTTRDVENGLRMAFTRFMAQFSDAANVSNIVQRIVRVARTRAGDYADSFPYHLRRPNGERFTAEFQLRGILDDNQYMMRAFGTVRPFEQQAESTAAPTAADTPPPAELDALRRRAEEVETHLGDIERQLSAARAEVATAASAREEYAERLRAAHLEIERLRELAADQPIPDAAPDPALQQQLADLSAQLTQANDARQQAEQRVIALQTEADALRAQITELRQQLDHARTQQASGPAPAVLTFRALPNGDPIVDLDEQAASLLGHATGSALMRWLAEWLHPSDAPQLENALHDLNSATPGSEIVLPLRVTDSHGRTRYLEGRLTATLEALEYRFTDHTEQRLAALEAAERDARTSAQENALAQFRYEDIQDLESLCLQATHAAVDTLELKRAVIWLLDADADAVMPALVYPMPENEEDSLAPQPAADWQALVSSLDNDPAVAVKFVTVDNRTTSLGHFQHGLDPVVSCIAVLAYREGQARTLLMLEHTGLPRDWQPDEVAFARALGWLIGAGFQSGHQRELQRRLADLQASHEELVRSAAAARDTRTESSEQVEHIQNLLVQREKLAALGSLAAGVAHEVNTPLSAIQASGRNIDRALGATLLEIPVLLRQLPDDTARLLLELVQQSSTSTLDISPEQERALRGQVQTILDRFSVPNAAELAKELVEIRVTEGVDRYIPLFLNPYSSDILDKVYKLAQLKRNLDNILQASDKAARVIQALRYYSHRPQQPMRMPVDLAESLDTALTLQQNRLKYGIAVERTFAAMPAVPVFPDEVAQVWNNLIANAVDALNGKGHLKVEYFAEGTDAVVRITDDGPGIPADALPHIFEPFYTTKPQGEGTGLGLDIARRIVERHGGTLTADSQPGRTTFTVRLPLSE